MASEMNFQVLPKNPETNTLQNDCIIILKWKGESLDESLKESWKKTSDNQINSS